MNNFDRYMYIGHQTGMCICETNNLILRRQMWDVGSWQNIDYLYELYKFQI